MSLLSLCNLTADVQRSTTTAQAGGGQSRAFTNVYTGVACCVQPTTGRASQNFHGKAEMDVDHNIYFPQQLSLRVNDRVSVDGTYYLVKAAGDMGGRLRFTKVWALRIDQA